MIKLNREALQNIVDCLDGMELQDRDFTGKGFQPEPHQINGFHVPYFYMAQAVNACGTGVTDPEKEAQCGDIWTVLMDQWQSDPAWFNPMRWSKMKLEEMEHLFCFQFMGKYMQPKDVWIRWQMMKQLGEAALERGWRRWTKEYICTLPGFSQDPIFKKANLLVAFLRYRPEKFINDIPDPIIDYHVMRVLIRTGILSIQPPKGIDLAYEELLRYHCFLAMNRLVERSRHDINKIDFLFWMMGKRPCAYKKAACLTGMSEECDLYDACMRLTHYREPRIQTINY